MDASAESAADSGRFCGRPLGAQCVTGEGTPMPLPGRRGDECAQNFAGKGSRPQGIAASAGAQPCVIAVFRPSLSNRALSFSTSGLPVVSSFSP